MNHTTDNSDLLKSTTLKLVEIDRMSPSLSGNEGLVFSDIRGLKSSLMTLSTIGNESVINNDNRKLVNDVTRSPFKMICSLDVHIHGVGSLLGTGALITPNKVLTCAHNFFRHEFPNEPQNKWDINVYAGRVGNRALSITRGIRVNFRNEYRSISGTQYDYAVITLEKEISHLGWFAVDKFNDRELDDATINLAGYPLDREDYTGRYMYNHYSDIYSKDARNLFYKADSEKGTSGAPIFVKLSDNEIPIIVGIHTKGDTNASPGASNQGRRINSEVYDDILSWV